MVTKRRAPQPPPVSTDRRRRATSYDVARRAGVSQSAVSRCFAPGTSIAPATREKILKIADELGYRPNALAQSLIAKQSQLIAVLISALGAVLYPKVLSEISRQLYVRNYRVLLFPLYDNEDVAEILDQALRHNVDGIVAAAHLDDDHLQKFHRHDVPIVLYNRVSYSPSLSSVCCDSAIGERYLVERLLAAGHRRFGIISGPRQAHISEVRLATALATLTAAGIIPSGVERCDYLYPAARTAMAALHKVDPHLDAVICTSDIMAIGAIDAARDTLGLRVPEDLSIVGFDGSDAAGWSGYNVTGYTQPITTMAEAAVQMLIERIEDPRRTPERRLFEGTFVEGRSARLTPVVVDG